MSERITKLRQKLEEPYKLNYLSRLAALADCEERWIKEREKMSNYLTISNLETEYNNFVEKYNGCTKCRLHHTTEAYHFCRGVLPCGILVISTSPKKETSIIGSKREIDFFNSVENRVYNYGSYYKEFIQRGIAFTSMLLCEYDYEDRKPLKECSDRLSEFIELSKASIVISYGSYAMLMFGNELIGSHMLYSPEVEYTDKIGREYHMNLLSKNIAGKIDELYIKNTLNAGFLDRFKFMTHLRKY